MYRLKQLILLGVDALVLYGALYVAIAVRTNSAPGTNFVELLPPMTALFVLAAILLFIMGAYDLTKSKNAKPIFKKIFVAALVWTVIGAGFFYSGTINTKATPKTILLLTTLFGFGAVALWRSLYNKFLAKNILKTRLGFVGFNTDVKEILEAITRQPELGYEIVGVITDSTTIHSTTKTFPSVASLVESSRVDILVLANDTSGTKIVSDLYSQLFKKASIITLPDMYERLFGRVPPSAFSDRWFITHLREDEKRIYDRVRTLADYIAACIMAVFFIITFPFIALAIKLTSRGPIFFSQTRLGHLGRRFKVLKYRTMQSLTLDGSAELNGPKYATLNDPRITTVGKFLRASRLDEIPQCINMLRGEMSLIGPRPERPEFVETLTKEMPYYTLRLLVKPGLTGWAQIQKSYYGTIAENLFKLEYDIFYIKNRGLLLDLGIVLRTINIVGSFGGR